MDPYDSDSSFDDEGDFSETNVLLGYAADEIVEDTISHLGGWPTWLDDATPPPGDFAKCKVCNQPMLLLLELHGDLPNDFPDDERRLYIFSCPRKACNRKPGTSTGPRTPWPAQSDFPAPYTNFYLDAEYETMSRPSTPTIPANVTIDNTEEEGPNGGAAELKDTFESELDKAFIRFSTRLGHNPEQVLRYEFRGSPLLYSHADAVGKRLHDPSKTANPSAKVTTVGGGSRMPRCEYCGSERVFELQLVPHAISVLEEGREGVGLGPKDDAGMEWGTIILGVCGKDCGPNQVGVVGYREEWAGVQWEEPTK
ncbi:Ca2+ regulator and membrane fusion protein Fig1 family protein [Aspergillus niger]|uniref:Ca2+ regulator and membrane fusion protein Fig1 family protein n=1 Tax=Aspergillus niger TaxID=5061 RepID=A0A505IMA2_ASPNG|nr:Ca2+ regulator and membrane fusion protein Fig1 family protein [Aspergillus niger]